MTKKFSLRLLFLSGTVALVLSACGSGTWLYDSGDPFMKLDSFYNYGAAGRDLRLIVAGNPFGPADDAFRSAVEAAVQVPTMRAPTHPTLAPGASARANYALVLAFQPPPTLSAQTLCATIAPGPAGAAAPGPAPVLAPAPGQRIEALGAFCLSGQALTQISGRVDAVFVTDQSFRDLMARMMNALFRPDMREWRRPGIL